MAALEFGAQVASTVRILIGALVMCCTVIAGCGTLMPGRATTTSTTTSPTSSLPPVEEARQVMGEFNLALPTDAKQIQVVKPPLEEFRAKALVSFVAPPEVVMNQTCKDIKDKGYDLHPIIGASFEKKILDYAGITINRNEYGSCDQYISGRRTLVLIPLAEGGTTYVVLYHVPYR